MKIEMKNIETNDVDKSLTETFNKFGEFDPFGDSEAVDICKRFKRFALETYSSGAHLKEKIYALRPLLEARNQLLSTCPGH